MYEDHTMLPKTRIVLVALAAAMLAGPVAAADLTESLKSGTPEIKSAGPIAFGPDGVLFIADTQSATIFAVATGDTKPANGTFKNIDGIDEKVASLLGTKAADIQIADLAVNPSSQNVYLSVARGKGPDAVPVFLRVSPEGIKEVSLKEVKFSKATLPNPVTGNAQRRQEAITDLAFVKGKVIVAGLSNEEFASRLRVIPFPFSDSDKGTGVEIYHGAHGALETRSPVRTFVAYDIKGEDHLLAAYTCTPLVKFPVADLKPGANIKGTTVAEMGSGNRPLDMITYKKDGKDYLLIANNRRGVMKMATDGIDKVEAITQRIGGGGTAGQKYETIASLKGVEQLDKLSDTQALVLVRGPAGVNLEAVPLP